jgi:hypothetical protein
MRQFAGSGVRIWNLSREAKAVYTCFLVASLLAFVSAFLLAEDMVGGRGAEAYYTGKTTAPALTPKLPRAKEGPAIDVPDADEPPRVSMEVAMPYRKLLEVAHFHLFTVPVFLLIVTHLFMLTGLQAASKLGWILAAWLTSLFHIGAPFIVRYGGPKLSWVFSTSGIAMALPLLVVTLYPAWAMWRVPPAARASAPGAAGVQP